MSLDHLELTHQQYGYVAGTQKYLFSMPTYHTYIQVCIPMLFTKCECSVQVSEASKA